jgi:hypothetical protein
VFGIYFAVRLNRDEPVTYAAPEDHFRYGSTGGERDAGIPYWLWKVLPVMFSEYLPQPEKGLASLGFVFDPTRPKDKDLPVGVSKRNVQGIDRVFLNCAVCHVGSVRDTPGSAPRIITGMPANTVDLPSGTFNYPELKKKSKAGWILALLAMGGIGFAAVVFVVPKLTASSAGKSAPKTEEPKIATVVADAAVALYPA